VEDPHVRFWERAWIECKPRLLGSLPRVQAGSLKARQDLLAELERCAPRLAHAPVPALRDGVTALFAELRETAAAAGAGDLDRAKLVAAAARRTARALEGSLSEIT
jgi:hypothetical protein